ncbi:MAG: BrnT family toxin [Proteobacteria bacterium]|nr:BrnT family toxin [Pseudomonadota bacterium]
MEFEYDLQKSDSNRTKHGIDFEEAKLLWNDLDRLQIQAKSETEPRYALIAKYGEKLWTAFFTIREDRIRIISVRRARKGEGGLYYEG